MKKHIKTAVFILIGSILYGIGTNYFIFPTGLYLGGTSGIAVLLSVFTDFSSGTILMILNYTLIVLAVLILGKSMAIKTLIGSAVTTLSIGLFERIAFIQHPLIDNIFLSAVIGAVIISIGSGFLFYVGSSSGGTDIIALLIQKYSKMNIGRALLISDILIVVLGGTLTDFSTAAASFIGFLVKTLGIDYVIKLLKKYQNRSAL